MPACSNFEDLLSEEYWKISNGTQCSLSSEEKAETKFYLESSIQGRRMM